MPQLKPRGGKLTDELRELPGSSFVGRIGEFADKGIACGYGTRFAQAMSFARPAQVGLSQEVAGSALFLSRGKRESSGM